MEFSQITDKRKFEEPYRKVRAIFSGIEELSLQIVEMLANAEGRVFDVFDEIVINEFIDYRVEVVTDTIRRLALDHTLVAEVGDELTNETSKLRTAWMDGYMVRGLIEEGLQNERKT